jgi:putative transposase
VALTVSFIDDNKELGVEPICRELQVAPSTYYAAKKREPSARARRDAVLLPVLVALWTTNRSVYGVRKLWKAARRAGYDLGRDQVARLMHLASIEGVRRGRKVKTTKGDPKADRAEDLVKRDFTAARPNQLWVVDLTYVATWSGFAYACFITDAFSRMIVGWRVATTMATDMVLDALDMARWQRGTVLQGLVVHSDAGSQMTSIRYGERLVELGAVPSIGSVGDAYDNALAESINATYKTELVRGPGQGPWRTVDDVELATLPWVHWYNNERLHEHLDYVPPVEYEQTWSKANTSTTPCVPQRLPFELAGVTALGNDESQEAPEIKG